MYGYRSILLVTLLLILTSLVSPLAAAHAGRASGDGFTYDRDGLLSYSGWRRLRGTSEMLRVIDEVVSPSGSMYDPVVERFFWENVVAGEWFDGYYTRLVVDQLIPGRKDFYEAFFHRIISLGFYRYVAGTGTEEPLVGREAFAYYYALLFYKLIPSNASNGFYYNTVLGDLALHGVWGFDEIIYYIIDHDGRAGRFYALAALREAARASLMGTDNPLFARSQLSGGFTAYSGAAGQLVVSISSINGAPLNGLAEIRSIGGGGGEAVEGIPWASPLRSQRVIVTVRSQYTRVNYPVPLRINFTELAEAGHVDGATLEAYMYDPGTGLNKKLNFSAVEVGYNTYWFVVEANLSSTETAFIVIYYDYGGAYSPGIYYGEYGARFPIPVDTSGGYEQPHAQLDKEVPRGSSYGDNLYLLLLAPKGTLLPVDDTENGTGHWLGDDDYYASSIPFPFQFSTLYIGSNGIVSPVYGITDWSDTLDELISRPALAVLWDDLKDYSGYTVYEYTGQWHGLQYKTWYWKTGYYSDGYDGRVRFRLYLMEDGTIGIHYYDFVPRSSRGWSPGFTTGISDSQGRWISPISSTSGRYALFAEETGTLNYDMVYVKLDTISYNVTVGGKGYMNRDGVYYKPIINGTLTAKLVPGLYEVVLRGGVYGYVGMVAVEPGENTSISLVAYPVSIGFTDSSGYPIGYLATELYTGPFMRYIETVHSNGTGYINAYFLEGTYTVHPLLMPSGNPYLTFTVSSTGTYPATYTYSLNVSRLTVSVESNATSGVYTVSVYDYYTGRRVKDVNITGEAGSAALYLAPGKYRVVLESYVLPPYTGPAARYAETRIGSEKTIGIELGEEAAVSFTLPALRISYPLPIPLHLYMMVELPGGSWLVDKGYVVAGEWYPVEPGEYRLVPDTLLLGTGCSDGQWNITLSVGSYDVEVSYEPPIEPGLLVVNISTGSSILHGVAVEIRGETVCGSPYSIEWGSGIPIPLLPGNYTAYSPSLLQAPWEAAAFNITSGGAAEAVVSVGHLVVRVIGYDGAPLPYAELVAEREEVGWGVLLTTNSSGTAETYLYPGNYTVVLTGYDKRYVWGNITVSGFNDTVETLLLGDADTEIGYGLGRLMVVMDAYGGHLAVDEVKIYGQLDANGTRGPLVAEIDFSGEHQDEWVDLVPGTYIVEAYSGDKAIYTMYNISVSENTVTSVEIPLVYLHISVASGPLPVIGAPVFVEHGGHVLGVWTTGGDGDVYVATVPGRYIVYTFTAGGEDFSSEMLEAYSAGETYDASLSIEAGVIHVVVTHNGSGIPGIPVSVSGYVSETSSTGELYVAVYPKNYTILLPYNGVSASTVSVSAGETVTVRYELSLLRIKGPVKEGFPSGTVSVELYVENDAGTYVVTRELPVNGETWFYVENGSYVLRFSWGSWTRSIGVTVSGDTVYTAPVALVSVKLYSKYPVRPFDVIISSGDNEIHRETVFIEEPLGHETIYAIVPAGTYSVRVAGLYYGDTGNTAGYGDSAGPAALGTGDTWSVAFNLSGIGIVGNASCGLVKVYAYIDGELVYYGSINTSSGASYIGLTRGYYVVELPNGARSNVLYVNGTEILVVTCYNVSVIVRGPRGEPVEGAHLLVKNNAGSTIYDLYTGPDGSASFSLINGSYRLVLPGSQYSYDPYMASIDRYGLLGYGAEYTLSIPTPNNTMFITLHRIDVETLIGNISADNVLLVLYTSDNRIVGGRITVDGKAVFYVTPGVYKLYIRGVAYAYDSYEYLGISSTSHLAGGGAFLGLVDVSGSGYANITYTQLSKIIVKPRLLNGSWLSYSYRLLYGTGSGYTAFSEGDAEGPSEAVVTPGEYRSEIEPPSPSPRFRHSYSVAGATIYVDEYFFTTASITVDIPSYPGSPYHDAEIRIYRGYSGPESPGENIWSAALSSATVYLEAGPVYGVVVPGPLSDGSSPVYGHGAAVSINSTAAAAFNIVFPMSLVVFNITSASGPVAGIDVGLSGPGGSTLTETGGDGLGYLLVTPGSYGFVLPEVYSGVLDTIEAGPGAMLYNYTLGELYVSLSAPAGLSYGNSAATIYIYDENNVAVSSATVSLSSAARLVLAVNHTYKLVFTHQYGLVEPIEVNVTGVTENIVVELGALVSMVAYINGTAVEGCAAGCLHRTLYAVSGDELIYLYSIDDNNASIALAPGSYRLVYSSNALGGADSADIGIDAGNVTWHTYRLALLNISVAASTGEAVEGAVVEIYSVSLGRVIATGTTNASGVYSVQLYGGSYRIRISTPGGHVVREALITAAAGAVNNISFTIEYADVEITGVTATPSSPSDGDTVYLYVAIGNNGPTHITHDFTVKAYVNGTLADEATVHGLLAGANTTIVLTLTASAGLMMITVIVDEEQTFFDENRGNNRYTLNISVEKPDLEITGVEITPPSADGASGLVSVNITNNGPGSIHRTIYVEITVGSVRVTRTLSGLEAGSSASVSASITMSSGPNEIHVAVDPRDEIREVREDNNEYTTTYMVPYVDLEVTITGFTYTELVEGETARLTYTVRNQGYGTVRTFYVNIYVDGNLVLTEPINGLGSGEEKELVYVHEIMGGGHTITVAVDPEGVVPENTTENNNATYSYYAPEPDLSVSGVSVNAYTLNYGESLIIRFNVTNTGYATHRTFYVHVYVDGEYYNITSFFGGIDGNATLSGQLIVTGIPDGGHVVKIAVDPENRVHESSEDNNAYAFNITVLASDIEIAGYTVNDTDLEAGEYVSVALRIRNNGPGAVEKPFYVSLFINNLFAEQRVVSGLGVGEEAVLYFTIQVGAGSLNATFIADDHYERSIAGYPVHGHHHEVGDPDRSNNALSVILYGKAPNYRVVDVVVEEDIPAWGQPSATLRLVNRGNATAMGNIIVLITVDELGFRNNYVYPLPRPLGPGDEIDIAIPAEYMPMLPPGTWAVSFTIDPFNDVAEENEGDNAATAYITVDYPDLAIVDVAASPSSGVLDEGDSVNLTITFANYGNTVYHPLCLRVVDSAGRTLYRQLLLNISGGKTYVVKTSINITPPGGNNYYAAIDYFNEIPESNEDNNIYQFTLPLVRSIEIAYPTMKLWYNRSSGGTLVIVNNGGVDTVLSQISFNVSWITASYTPGTVIEAGKRLEIPLTVDTVAAGVGSHAVRVRVKLDGAVFDKAVNIIVIRPEEAVHGIEEVPGEVNATLGGDGELAMSLTWPAEYNVSIVLGGNASVFFTDRVINLSGGAALDLKLPYSIEGAEPGTYVLYIAVYAPGVGVLVNRSVVFTIQNRIDLVVHSPGNNTEISTSALTIVYETDPEANSTIYVTDTASNNTIIINDPVKRRLHVYRLGGLEYYHTYRVIIVVSTAHRTLRSKPYYVSINPNAAVFLEHSLELSVGKAYNQRFTVAVANNDPYYAHRVVAWLINPYSDLIIGFVGPGSVDEPLILSPGASAQLTLAIHTQDAERDNYTVYAVLMDLDTGRRDVAEIHITVKQPVFNITITHLWTNNYTMVQAYMITNHGDTITDLSIVLTGPAASYSYIYPAVSHGLLESGSSMIIYVVPSIPAMPDDVWKTSGSGLAKGTIMLLTPGNGGGGSAVTAPVDMTPPSGTKPYGVNHPGAELRGEAADWYCTNRPIVETTLPVSHDPPVGSYEAYLLIDFHPHSNVRPHNVHIYVNGHLVYSLINTTPSGTIAVEVPYEYLNIDPSGGVSYVRVKIVSEHMNGGHYIVATNFRLLIMINKPTPFYVFAHSYEEAVGIFSGEKRLGILAGILSKNGSYINPTKKPKDEGCTDEKLREQAEKLKQLNIPGQPKFNFMKEYLGYKIGVEVSMKYAGSIDDKTLDVTNAYGGGGKLVIETPAFKVELGAEGSVEKTYKPNRAKCTYECATKKTQIKILPSSYTFKIGSSKVLSLIKKFGRGIYNIIRRIAPVLIGNWTLPHNISSGTASSPVMLPHGDVSRFIKADIGVEITVKDITIDITEDCKTGAKTVSVSGGLISFSLKGVLAIDSFAELELGANGDYRIEARNNHLYLTISGGAGIKATLKAGWFSLEITKSFYSTSGSIQILGSAENMPKHISYAIGRATEEVVGGSIVEAFASLSVDGGRTFGINADNITRIVFPVGYDKSILGENVFSRAMYNASVSGYDIVSYNGALYAVYAASSYDNTTTIYIYRNDDGEWSYAANLSVDGIVASIDADAGDDAINIIYAVYRGVLTDNISVMMKSVDKANYIYYTKYMVYDNEFSEPILVAKNTTRDVAIITVSNTTKAYWVVRTDTIDYVVGATIVGAGIAYAEPLTTTYSSDRIMGLDACNKDGGGIVIYKYTEETGYPNTVIVLYSSDGEVMGSTRIPDYVSAHAVVCGDNAAYVIASTASGETWLSVFYSNGTIRTTLTDVWGYVSDAAYMNETIYIVYTAPRIGSVEDSDIYTALINPLSGRSNRVAPIIYGTEFSENKPKIVLGNGYGYVFYLRSLLDNNPYDNKTYGYALAYMPIGGLVIENITLDGQAPYEPGLLRISIRNNDRVNYTGILFIEQDGVVVYRIPVSVPAEKELVIRKNIVLPGPGRHTYSAYIVNATPERALIQGAAGLAIEVPWLLDVVEPGEIGVYNASSIPFAATASLGIYNASLIAYTHAATVIKHLGQYMLTPQNNSVSAVLDASELVKNDTYLPITVGLLRGDGKASVEEISVPVDVLPPRIRLFGLTNGSALAGVANLTITVYDVFLDAGSTSIMVNGTPVDYSVVTGGGGYAEYHVVLNTTRYPSGRPLYIDVYARDRSGKSARARYVVVPYNEAPLLALSLGNNSVVGSSAVLRVNITGLYLDSIMVYINNSLVYAGSANTSQSINMSFPEDGYYIVKVVVNNTLGYTASKAILLYSDQRPPSITVALGSLFASDTLSAVLEAADRSGRVTLYYSFDDAAEWVLLGAPGNYTIDTGGLDEGTHVLLVKAVDRFGNSRVVHMEFIVDRTPPTVTLLRPGNNTYAAGILRIVLNASDQHLAWTRIYINGTLYAENTTSLLLNTSSLPDGTYIVMAVASDMAGNTAAETRRIIIDNTPPHIEITGVENGTTIEATEIKITVKYWDKNLRTALLLVDNNTYVLFSMYEKTLTLNLSPGWHTITLLAEDKAGNTVNKTIIIQVKPPSPTSPATPTPETPLLAPLVLVAISLAILARKRKTREE